MTDIEKSQQQFAENEFKNVFNLINNDVIKSNLITQKIRHRLTGERYSIFDVLGKSDSETSHSLFLRHLLDPTATHDHGTVFLDCFINTLKKLAKAQKIDISEDWPNDWHSAKSLTEVVHKDGRIDIVIEIPNKACIVIENKIWALEQNRQMARYGDWLKSKKYKHVMLVFLTPTGCRSQTKESFDVVNISYDQISQFLTSTLNIIEPTATPLLSVVKQYIGTCNYIFSGKNIMPHSNKAVIDLLNNTHNFEIALNIKTYADEISIDIFKKFISNVLNLLNEKLKHESLYQNWTATGLSDYGIDKSISIETDISDYRFLYGNIFDKNPSQRHFGWYHPGGEIKSCDENARILINKMKDHYSSQSTPAWLYCIEGNQELPIPTMNMSWEDIKTKLTVMEDNQKDHLQDRTTLANGLANAIWDLFSKYRVDVENLKPIQG